jgi:TonB family protein
MPLYVRRFYTSLLFVLFGIILAANAQTVPPTTTTPNTSTATAPATTQTLAEPIQQIRTPTAAEIMRDRISKAKAYIAVRNYSAANYELESIRRESADTSVLSVVNVLLMNSYLEQGDYKRAQDLLGEAYNIQKTTKPGASETYFAIAGQIVKGARNRVERYRALGLNPSDRTLPLEAINDLEKMREMLETVVTQSKEISNIKSRSQDALAMLEEASTSRSMIARDDYDAGKWQNEVADFREDLASSRSVVLSAVTETPATTTPSTTQTVAMTTPQQSMIADTSYSRPTNQALSSQPLVKPTSSSQPINAPAKTTDTPQYVPMQQPATQQIDVQRSNRVIPNQPVVQTPVQNTQPAATQPTPNKKADKTAEGPTAIEPPKTSDPIAAGSLLTYAVKQQQPNYPMAARNMRTTGVVTVSVLVDEEGNVAEVQGTSGPSLLQSAAKDAIRKWHFKPFLRDGQPVKATGFVSFNFAL